MLHDLNHQVSSDSSLISHASKFHLTYGEGTTLDQIIGFEMAAGVWSASIDDDVTINIHVEVNDNLPERVVGGALPGLLLDEKIKDVQKALSEDVTSSDDGIVADSLPLEGKGDEKVRVVADRYELKDAKIMDLTRANAKALDLIDGSDPGLDGIVMMSTLSDVPFSWNYSVNPSTIPGHKVDFFSVALHELGHTLGFVSGVDDFGWLEALAEAQAKVKDIGELGGKDPKKKKEYEELGKKNEYVAYPLDFFRYSGASTSWKDEYIDLSVGEDAYFSLDGRQPLAFFSTGKDGDGYQASHWKQQEQVLGVMQPAIALGTRHQVSPLDLQAFDVMGWDIVQRPENILLDFDALVQQAYATVAQKLGVSVDWLMANPESAAQSASQTLTRDRTSDISTLLYEGRRRRNRNRKSVQSRSWQELLEVFTQEGLFSSFSDEDLQRAHPSSHLPNTVEREALVGGMADDQLRGDRTADVLRSKAGDDLSYGRQDADILLGGSGEDRLAGNQGADVLNGGSGDDALFGGRGDDRLEGRSGHDDLRGGPGNDILMGYSGLDQLRGGRGADTFVVDNSSGIDTVTDFEAQQDRVGIAPEVRDVKILQDGSDVAVLLEQTIAMILKQTDATQVKTIAL